MISIIVWTQNWIIHEQGSICNPDVTSGIDWGEKNFIDSSSCCLSCQAPFCEYNTFPSGFLARCYGTSCCVTRRIRGGNWHHISLYICDKQDILPYPPLCCIWILNRLHFGSLFAWHGLTMFDFWSTKTDSFWVRCLEVASMREELKCFRESHIQGAMFCHLTLWDGFNLVFENITGLLG